MGKELGFKLIIVDQRSGFANPEKYPEADETLISNLEEIASKVTLNEMTFVLIKTNNYLKDEEILKQVLKSKARYVGLLVRKPFA